jgi:branched-chain amino acid aminotransferase
MSEKVFLNNSVVDKDKAAIPVDDGGLLYGAGLFETMRSYNGKIAGLDMHLDRLFSSARKLGLMHNFKKDFLTDAVYQTLTANELEDARLRLTATSGPMTAEAEKINPRLLITAAKLEGYPEEYYEKGVMVVLCPFRQNVTDPLSGHKTLNYFTRMLALRLGQQKKAAEVLWFTTDNRLAEGCISNVFLVKDSVIYTPKLDTPVLDGIVRRYVFDIARENSFEIKEKDLSLDDTLDADEVFLTNSIIEVLPVANIEKHTVGKGKPGEITKKIYQDYKKRIKQECGS